MIGAYVAVDDEQVGGEPRAETTGDGREAQHLGGVRGRRRECVLEGARVRQLDDRTPHAVAVELGSADARVGTRDDADAVLQGQPQLLGAGDAHGVRVQAQALHQLPQLRREGTHPDRSAVPADGRVDDDPGRGDGVEQVGRGAQALLGQAGEVLEAVDAGVDGVPRAPQGVGVGEDLEPGLVPEVDDQPQVLGGELHAELVAARRQHAARGHHLDHVDPALDVLGHGRADRVSTLGGATQVVAVPVGDGERRSRRHDPRDARRTGVPEAQRPVPPVAQVADRGHPSRRLLAQRAPDDGVDLVVGHRAGGLQAAGHAVGHQVHVRVDEPGQHGAGVRRHLDASRGREVVRLHADDAITLDQDRGPAATNRSPSKANRARIPRTREVCTHAAAGVDQARRVRWSPWGRSWSAPMGAGSSSERARSDRT